jgi:C-terminal processing protease CtpA/Prc
MLYFKKNLLLIFLGSITSIVTFSQPFNGSFKKIPQAELRQDFLVMKDTLQKIHAGLYTYKTKAEIDHVFDSCYATIPDSMTVPEFFALTRFVLASIEDGHTNCRLPEHVLNDFMSNVKAFPAMVLFINNRAFIYCCKQNTNLAETEIISIDNHSMDEITRQLFDYICSDAGIQSRKNWEMPEDFQLLYNIVYGTKNSYNIRCKRKTGEIKTARLQADLMKNIFCTNPFPRPAKYLQLMYTPDHIAVLTLKSFFDGFLEQTGENFSKFLDSSFDDIKKKQIKKVLIDVRSNQGGNDGNGEVLYSYLTQKPFMYYASQETVTEKFSERDHSNLKLQQPKENSFNGSVFILMNGRSFSGVAEFSSIVKTNNRGVFIGEECGGGYYGNTSGDEAMVVLPNTQIIVRVPMIKYTMAVKEIGNKNKGILPDYPFYPTISDIIENTDGQMKYAQAIVAKE